MVTETHRQPSCSRRTNRAQCLLVTTLPACGTLYVAQAARGQWQVMHAREPIDKVIAERTTPAELRARLTEVRAARDFASRELGLPDNASYRSYADLQAAVRRVERRRGAGFSVHPAALVLSDRGLRRLSRLFRGGRRAQVRRDR